MNNLCQVPAMLIDRFRFRRSCLSSFTSARIRRYDTWPEDARDFGLRDSLADNQSRLN